jgi:hypothetical protein
MENKKAEAEAEAAEKPRVAFPFWFPVEMQYARGSSRCSSASGRPLPRRYIIGAGLFPIQEIILTFYMSFKYHFYT